VQNQHPDPFRALHLINVGMWLERFNIIVISPTGITCRPPGVFISQPSGIGPHLSVPWPVLRPAVFVHPFPAGDLNLRDAELVAEQEEEKSATAD
jgi:hypothetical protein